VAVRVGAKHFRLLVAEALDSIPESLGRRMDNVAVTVKVWPEARQLAGLGPGRTLLGLYEGTALTQRGPLSYVGAMPDRITIFAGPITARARDEEDLVAMVRTTVIHEVAHHFGISDERLVELGWA
jgi:predicted Zn-dependent protease with MMP-like domain